MTGYLMRDQAPLQASEWQALDDIIVRVARQRLVARRFLSLFGPVGAGQQSYGVDRYSDGSGGQIALLDAEERDIVTAQQRRLLPLPILYRDLRTYGQREELYQKARELGVVFINYDMHAKPQVRVLNDERLEVLVWDHVLHQPFKLPADVLVLATAIVPYPEAARLASVYKLPQDSDGFFQEAHVKLRPVDFSTDGLFMAGLAHYPKPIEESISQAGAAVARAVTVLSKTRIDLDSIKAVVDPERCDGCALCLDVCPYQAISLEELGDGKRRVAINQAQCKGCGCCMATCPKLGVDVAGFSYRQLAAQVAAALD